MTDSYIQTGAGGTSFVGPDGVNLYRAIALKSALGACVAGFRITRTMTPSRCLAMATEYTGKKYKRGQLLDARADLTEWINAMKAGIPIVTSTTAGTIPASQE